MEYSMIRIDKTSAEKLKKIKEKTHITLIYLVEKAIALLEKEINNNEKNKN